MKKYTKRFKRFVNVIYRDLLLLAIVYITYFCMNLYNIDILPSNIIVLIYIGFIVLLVLVSLLIFPKNVRLKVKRMTMLVVLIMVLVTYVYNRNMIKYNKYINNIKDISYINETFNIYSTLDKNYNLYDLSDKKIGIYYNENIINYKKLELDLNTYKFSKYKDLNSLYDDLINKKLDFIVINESSYKVLEYNYDNLELRYVDNIIIKYKLNNKEAKNININKKSFNILLLSSNSNELDKLEGSTLNCIINFDLKNKYITINNLPSSYFIEFNNKMETLYHLSNISLNDYINSIESKLGITINYYFYTNHNTIKDVINLIGGIDLYNDYSFNVEGNDYNKGYIELKDNNVNNYLEEVDSFSDRDLTRVKNQQNVIKAIVSSSNINLVNYGKVLSTINDKFYTNMSSDTFKSILKYFINNKNNYNISSYYLSGLVKSEKTYTYPNNNCYIIYPSELEITKVFKKESK